MCAQISFHLRLTTDLTAPVSQGIPRGIRVSRSAGSLRRTHRARRCAQSSGLQIRDGHANDDFVIRGPTTRHPLHFTPMHRYVVHRNVIAYVRSVRLRFYHCVS